MEEAFIDENLRLRMSETSCILIQGSSYVFLAQGMMGIVFSMSVFFICIGTSKWDGVWFILAPAPLSLLAFGLQRRVEIDAVNKLVVKQLCLFNKLKVKLYQKAYGEKTFLIKEVDTSENTLKELYLQGELEPVFLFTFNSEKTAANFHTFIERNEMEFIVKEI